MTPESVMSLGQRALELTILISAPPLLSVLVTGVVIGMLQAATQIQELTLSFIPKLLVLSAALFVAGPWMLGMLVDFTRELYTSIPAMLQE